ncbi:hypothetical protein GE09DRAFT_1220969 [Coniochaeta sp. 2T2.1]|nr:hypothetical protein GE09DRAFT_1220969 [Coniochaeta sp. 2T2.1]
MGDTSPSARRGYSTEEKFFIIYQFTNKLPWSEIHKNFNERFPARRLICLQKENARLNRACPIIEDDGQLIFVSPGSTDTKVNEYNNLTRPLPAKKAKGVPLSSRYAEQLADGEFSWLSPEDLKEAHELAGLRRPLREAWESARAKERAQGKESLQAAWEIRIRNMFRALRTTDQWLVQRLARAKLEDDDKGRPFVCTWENCIGLKFDKKKQWVRHEHTSHRHLKTWNCNAHGCGYHSFRRSNFRDHLIRVHKFDKNNAYMQLNSRHLSSLTACEAVEAETGRLESHDDVASASTGVHSADPMRIAYIVDGPGVDQMRIDFIVD